MKSKLFLMLLVVLPADAQQVVIHKPEYTSVYDLQLRCPRQVEWSLRSHDLGDSSREPAWKFKNDVPAGAARHQDYYNSGYDRGHLCPAQDRSAANAAMRATFTMSNIAPQVPALNRGPWKMSEVACRSLAIRYDSIQVVVVPLFLNRDTIFIGSHRLAVPHAFLKAAWNAANDSVIGCWFYFNK